MYSTLVPHKRALPSSGGLVSYTRPRATTSPSLLCYPTEQHLGLRRRIALEAGQDVGVGVHRRADLALAQDLRHEARMHALGDQ